MSKKQHGVGAICSVLKRFLHPSNLIREKYVNHAKDERLEGLFTIREEVRSVNRKDVLCLVFRHDDFENQLLYWIKKYARILHEGPEHTRFAVRETVDLRNVGAEEGEALPDLANRRGRFTREDVDEITNQGFTVDDDNEPAPENVPANNRAQTGRCITDEEWGWKGFCHQKSACFHHTAPRISGLAQDMISVC